MRWFTEALISGLVVVAGCALDFTGPPTPEPPVFSVFVVLQDIPPSASFTVRGDLMSGRDANGQLRVLQDSIALIWGKQIEPEPHHMGEAWLYHSSWVADPATIPGAALCVQPPLVSGVEIPDDPVCTAATWRAGASEFAVSRGSELKFELVGPESSESTSLTSQRWRILITAGDTGLVTVEASGSPPQTVVIQGDWLAAAPPGDLEAEMQITSNLVSESNGYAVRVGVQTTLHWILTLVD